MRLVCTYKIADMVFFYMCKIKKEKMGIIEILLLGITTFIISLIGVKLGNRFGDKYESKAGIAGGIVLILIGIKILLEHIGIVAF